MNIKSLWGLIRETFHDWNEDKAPRLAAALSYYTVFSLAPLLVLVIAITGFIVGNNETIRNQIITQVQGTVGQQGAQAVSTLIDNTSRPHAGIIATVIGIATLLLGATGVFGQLQDSLNTIWEVKPKEGRGIMGMVKDRFLSFAMVVGVCFLLLVSLVISTALSLVNQYFTSLLGNAVIVAQVINIIISIGVITLIFAMIFKVLPDVQIRWRDVWIGALVTALLFSLGKYFISYYLSSGATSSVYGAAGSLVVLLLWVYYSAQILFMGAEFTQVYARHMDSQIVPTKNAQPVTETERAQQGTPRHQKPVMEGVQGALIPVAGQPAIHPPSGAESSSMFNNEVIKRARVRYEPHNPATVIPVIAAGTVAGAIAIGKIIRKITE